MPYLKRGEASIYYEEFGSGFPVLLFAPGSLEATIEHWHKTAAFDPTKVLVNDFRLIGMDLRNAGHSWAPITASSGWDDYLDDAVAILDHLGVQKCHLLGQCIGGPLSMGMLQKIPERIEAVVFMQPSGRIGPFVDRPGAGFNRWAAKLSGHPEATPEVLASMKKNMYTNDFIYTTSRDFARTVKQPSLVLPGNDDAHPFQVGVEIYELVQNSEIIREWRTPELLPGAVSRIREFLLEHTPVAVGS